MLSPPSHAVHTAWTNMSTGRVHPGQVAASPSCWAAKGRCLPPAAADARSRAYGMRAESTRIPARTTLGREPASRLRRHLALCKRVQRYLMASPRRRPAGRPPGGARACRKRTPVRTPRSAVREGGWNLRPPALVIPGEQHYGIGCIGGMTFQLSKIVRPAFGCSCSTITCLPMDCWRTRTA